MLEEQPRSLEESRTTESTIGVPQRAAWIKSFPAKVVSVFTGKRAPFAIALSSLVIIVSALGVSALVNRSLKPTATTNAPLASDGGTGGQGTDSSAGNKPGSTSQAGLTDAAKPQSKTTTPATSGGSNSASSGGSSSPSTQPGTSTPAPVTSIVKTFLAKHTVGTLHEAIPHGVPANHEHRTKAVLKYPSPPNAEMTYINIRGAVYVDESNYRAPNTRVEIINCQTYGLKQATNTWEKLIDLSPGKLAGKGWHEDFSAPGDISYTNIRTEASGSKSVINYDGYNLHYFNNTNLAPLVYVGYNYSEFVTGCSTRLILEDPSGPDNRSLSAYIITAGNDWKKADNTCTVNAQGSTLCYAIGAGRYIKVKSNWRRVVYSSLDSADLESKPMPPEALFINPDGSFGD